jgi:hypothetical protein
MNYHHEGNLEIKTENVEEYAHLKSVSGYLSVQVEGFSAPALTSVGNLIVYAAGFSSPALKSVGKLIVHAPGFSAPVLKSVGGDLTVYAEGFFAPSLKSVGYLSVQAEGFSAPALKSVRNLSVRVAGFSAPALKSVRGDLSVHAPDFSAPVLKSVGGDLNIEAEGFSAPALTTVGGLRLPDPAIAHERLVAVAKQVIAQAASIEMQDGDTASGIRRWAIEFAGDEGNRLEKKYGRQGAATHLLGLKGAELFLLDNDKALNSLKAIVNQCKDTSERG